MAALEKNPKKIKTSNLPDKKFKETVIRIHTKLESGIEELRENLNEELRQYKKQPSRPEEYSNK